MNEVVNAMADSGDTPRSKTKSTMKFAAKDRVEHSVFGSGTITSISTTRTTVDFDESGPKTFVTSMVRLAQSDTPAPPPRTRRKKKVASRS